MTDQPAEATVTPIRRGEVDRSPALAIQPGQQIWTAVQLSALESIGLKDCPDSDRLAFLHLCQSTGLDPFRREIYLLGRRVKDGNNWTVRWTPQTGIDGFRHLAEETGVYGGRVGPHWTGDGETWRKVWSEREGLVAARCGVIRTDRPHRCRECGGAPGGADHVTEDAAYRANHGGEPLSANQHVFDDERITWAIAHWDEFVPMEKVYEGSGNNRRETGEQRPTSMWRKMPANQLGKCLPGTALVDTDRGPLSIGRIVRERLAVRVRSVDESGAEVFAPVVGWFRNGSTDEWVRISVNSGRRRGSVVLRLTAEHPVLTPIGWVEAGDLKAGDLLGVTGPRLSDEQRQVLLGGLLGDGSLGSQRGNNASYTEAHSAKQASYLRWKAAALDGLGVTVESVRSNDGAGGGHDVIRLRTRALPCVEALRGKPTQWLAGLADLGLAVWIMDDGSLVPTGSGPTCRPYLRIFCCGFGTEFADTAARWFADRYGIEPTVARRQKNPYLSFTVEQTAVLLPRVARWLSYDDATRTKKWLGGEIPQGTPGVTYVPARSVERELVRSRPGRGSVQYEGRYDIEVEGTHAFVSNGVVLHNCAEAAAVRAAFPRSATGLFEHAEMDAASAAARELEEAERDKQRRELTSRPWAKGPGGESGVVLDPSAPTYDRTVLLAELEEQARAADKTVLQYTTRWAAAHKKTIDQATDAEIEEFLAARRSPESVPADPGGTETPVEHGMTVHEVARPAESTAESDPDSADRTPGEGQGALLDVGTDDVPLHEFEADKTDAAKCLWCEAPQDDPTAHLG